MNLFCFTLAYQKYATHCCRTTFAKDGSTESMYEPPYGPSLKEPPPKYPCSPSLQRCKLEWGGSDPAISSGLTQATIKMKRNNRRSCLPTLPSKDDTIDKDSNYTCWMSRRKNFSHHLREMCKAPRQSSPLTRDDGAEEPNSDRTRTDLPAQGVETSGSKHTTERQNKSQNLVPTNKAHQDGAGRWKRATENKDQLADVLSNNNPVLTCIGLGRRAENKPPLKTPSPQRHQRPTRDVHEATEEEGLCSYLGSDQWSPLECPQPWTPLYHTCRQPPHQTPLAGGTLSLHRTPEWDRFESLIQELDSKQCDLSPSERVSSFTDVPLPQNTLTRLGGSDASGLPSPPIKPSDKGSALLKQWGKSNPTKPRLQRRETGTSPQSDRKQVEASPEKPLTAITTQKDGAQKKEACRRPFRKGHGLSSNSLESLYSLNSGQSSSSGITSGSGCSSNRDSLRMEEDLLYTRPLCVRAKVHTDFMPSPYDTESLKLKVGDVIDIIAKPSMGIWTGMLNGKTGNFKFIYVDVLTEESPQTCSVKQKSTVKEFLKRLSLEEHFSSLQLNGFQTVDDLMRLKEHHVTELNVTDPEHRLRLLSAVRSLQKLRTDSQPENVSNQGAETSVDNMNAHRKNCPRDSGCHMPSDSPDISTEDTELHLVSEYSPQAKTAAL